MALYCQFAFSLICNKLPLEVWHPYEVHSNIYRKVNELLMSASWKLPISECNPIQNLHLAINILNLPKQVFSSEPHSVKG